MFTAALLLVGQAGVFAQPGVPKMSSPLYGGPPDSAQTANGLPQALKEVSIDQRLDAQVPLDLQFKDETGKLVQLGDYFKDGKPVVLALVYYECPMLCNQVLNGLVGSLRGIAKFDVGREFHIVTVSFDARETPELAARKKENYIRLYGRANAENGWHFLTGAEPEIKRLTEATGFKYKWDAATNQFAHASAIMVLTPQGKLSHYLYGIDFAPRDLQFALIEASQNKIGSPVDQLMLFCYHYDPATGKYGVVIMNVLKLAGVLTIIGIAVLIMGLLALYKNPRQVDLKAGGTA